MRRLLAFLCVVGLLFAWTRIPLVLARAPGQFGYPRRSPHESTEGKVNGASLSITYGRPSMRGRKIFGGLVPFGQVWCPGADQCTTLSTDRDLQFTGFTLQAGEYSMWVLPTEAVWSLIFNGDSNAFHTGRRSREDVGKIQLQKQTLPSPVEQLTFAIEANKAGPGGAIVMSWETTRVSAPFIVVAR